MRTSLPPSSRPHVCRWGWLAALALVVPSVSYAQYGAPGLETGAVGEKYHIEVAGSFWNPDVFGLISSEQFGLIGSKIDFVSDLGFEKTRFKDFRLVLRPSRKLKFRIQHTPVQYVAETSLKREIIFNGQKFPVSLPLQSKFDWNVWRLGLEYDFVYRSRGFVGILLEGRYTRMNASLKSPLVSEFTAVKVPLPAIGVVGRAYVLRELALNFEVSTFQVPKDVLPNVEANYYDWNIGGTLNVSNYVGLEVGWRRMTNFLNVKKDTGDTKFQGLYFGAALRY